MKDMSKTECETPTAIPMESTKVRSERLKGTKMKTQEMRNKINGFLIPSPHGFATTESCVIGVGANFGGIKENDIVQTANGTNLKTQFFKVLKRVSIAFKNFCARGQMNDNTVEILRSERSGKWCSHSDYIKETIEREKMRIYDIR
jgi:hypothetical protein